MKKRKEEDFLEQEQVASATECTGLVPALQEDELEGQTNEARLYGIHLPKENEHHKNEYHKK